jgi:hypothetical protein
MAWYDGVRHDLYALDITLSNDIRVILYSMKCPGWGVTEAAGARGPVPHSEVLL